MKVRFTGLTRLLFRFCVQLRALMLVIMLSPVFMPLASASEPEQSAVLELGVAPFLPARTLVQNYQPMRAYLEQHLKRPVLFVTAPDYKTFYERTQRREYPVIITIANAAYQASAEAGYVPMLQPVIKTCPVLVVPDNSALANLQDLRGQTIALPDPLAIISMQGVHLLRESGLDPGKDIYLRYLPNHSTAVNHVISGEVSAAIISDRALLQMPAAIQKRVRVVRKWEEDGLPGVVYLASPALPRQQIEQLTVTILHYTRDTPEGREFIKKLGYGGLIPATKDDLKPLAPYGKMLKESIIRSSKQQSEQ